MFRCSKNLEIEIPRPMVQIDFEMSQIFQYFFLQIKSIKSILDSNALTNWATSSPDVPW